MSGELTASEIERFFTSCGKPVLRFKIVRDLKKDCKILYLRLKCKEEGCEADLSIQISV
jgi:hypothetical protein